MATSLAATVKVSIDGSYTSTQTLGTAKESIGVQISTAFANGVGDDQADFWAHDERTVVNPTTDTVDLNSTLTDPFGTTFNLVTLKGIIVVNQDATDILTLSGDAVRNADFFGITTGQIKIKPKGVFVCLAPKTGYTITATTQDQLDFDADTGTIIYDLYLLGTSS